MQQSSSTGAWPFSAAAVHLYTASGAVLAFLIVLAAFRNDPNQALWLGLIALIIDSTDGTLARRFRVSERLPSFDGRRLDDIVDYLTYVFAPVLLLWSGGYLGAGLSSTILAALPLLASSYQFCRVDAKTDDHFFLGFPSYWNVVAFYVIVFNIPQTYVSLILVICSLLVFVPIRYVYPSRTVAFRPLTIALTVLWLIGYGLILLAPSMFGAAMSAISLLFLVYYFGLSLYLTFMARASAE